MSDLTRSEQAWNRLIENCFAPGARAAPNPFGAAATVTCFYCETGSGGLLGFVTVFPEIGTGDVCAALETMGAHLAAEEFRTMVAWLGGDLPAGSREERDAIINAMSLEDQPDDTLSAQAERQLTVILEAHVEAHLAHYLALPEPSWPSNNAPNAA